MYTIIDTHGNTVNSKKSKKPFEYTTYKTAFMARDILEQRLPKNRRPLHVIGTAP